MVGNGDGLKASVDGGADVFFYCTGTMAKYRMRVVIGNEFRHLVLSYDFNFWT